jgi:hypothetical protein
MLPAGCAPKFCAEGVGRLDEVSWGNVPTCREEPAMPPTLCERVAQRQWGDAENMIKAWSQLLADGMYAYTSGARKP